MVMEHAWKTRRQLDNVGLRIRPTLSTQRTEGVVREIVTNSALRLKVSLFLRFFYIFPIFIYFYSTPDSSKYRPYLTMGVLYRFGRK